MSSGPWKTASSSSSSVNENNAGGRKSDPTRSFPPLSAHTQTKTQRRTRALYSQTPHFNPYPPRQEQLNRQELDRLQLDSEGGETPLSADYKGDEESQRQDERTTGERSLGSGMSSITLLNKDGERFVRGSEYCYRRKTASSSLRRGDNQSAAGSSMATSERQKAPFTKRRRRGAEERQVDLPTPFTDAKIDALVTECKRRRRALAAEQRQAPEKTDAQQRQDSCKPFTDELEKAFSSIDGFLAAFSKDGVGEGGEAR